jgi:hypothetical protein
VTKKININVLFFLFFIAYPIITVMPVACAYVNDIQHKYRVFLTDIEVILRAIYHCLSKVAHLLWVGKLYWHDVGQLLIKFEDVSHSV